MKDRSAGKGMRKKGTKKMFGKTYNNCVKKEEVDCSHTKKEKTVLFMDQMLVLIKCQKQQKLFIRQVKHIKSFSIGDLKFSI